MVKSSSCYSLRTKTDKSWRYEEYYLGPRDHEERRNERGENHWSGAESLEWYTGNFLRDTMHGYGDYRWRYRGPEGTFVTYEGNFYSNRMHGYGTMSYPDGRVFTGLYHSNVRWGPGIESYACMRDNVGLWRGTQLVRLAWCPPTPNIVPDLCASNVGKSCVESYRITLAATTKIVGETNSALDLLKQHGSDSRWAAERWINLYPKHCTDQASKLCQVDIFQHEYYNGKIHSINEIDVSQEYMAKHAVNVESLEDAVTYFAWNNSDIIVHMMKHCYQHEQQRTSEIDIPIILNGSRKKFKPPAKHEIDCRTLLMASFLGHVSKVVEMISEFNVHPNIADSQGNTALIYATCGDHSDLIHFLVEAGANVDYYNDCCCTALNIALLRFICIQKDIAPSGMLQALLPPIVPAPSLAEIKILEWNMIRNQQISFASGPPTRTASKTNKNMFSRNVKSSQSFKEVVPAKKKIEVMVPKPTELREHLSDDTFSEKNSAYNVISNEYSIRMQELFSIPSGVMTLSYIFEINDLMQEVNSSEHDPKKIIEKGPKKIMSKVLKETIKPSKENIWRSPDQNASVDSIEKHKREMITRTMSTILQLMSDGANPNLVKYPQPALFIAAVAGSADLIRHLVHYGADVNEVYPQVLGYTPLDIAISRQFTNDNLDLIRALLECGSNTNYKLPYEYKSSDHQIPGPTLLHAVLAKKTNNEFEEEICCQTLELLLEYNCDPIVQFKGRSAVDVAMTKNVNLLDIFVKSPSCNLNAIINDQNQTVLVKMFYLPFFRTTGSTDRLQTLTNLILYGADPLIDCQDGEEKYSNIFVYAKKSLAELEISQGKTNPINTQGKADSKHKSKEKSKKEEKFSTKSLGKVAADDIADYRQALDLVTECARLLYIRWLQANLMKELIDIIKRWRHRQWNMILEEHKHKKCTSLWLSAQRCLEIWDILKNKRWKVYNDKRILKHLLCIVQYYQIRFQYGFISNAMPTAQEKNLVDANVSCLMEKNKKANVVTSDLISGKKPYVLPELASKDDQKFNVCFECIIPFDKEKIECEWCKLVAFCSFDCMRKNVDRINCHPCSDYLKNKYFTSPNDCDKTKVTQSNMLL